MARKVERMQPAPVEPEPTPAWDPGDEAEIDAAMVRAEHEMTVGLRDELERAAASLRQRRIPVRSLRPVVGKPVTRMLFADHTVLLAIVPRRDMAEVLWGIEHGYTTISYVRRSIDGVEATITTPGRDVVISIIGFDQPD